MTKYDYIINNATIINEGARFTGSVFIKNGIIERVSESPGYQADNIIDGNGLLLVPGIIDDQVHFREPGLTHKGDIHSESTAAVAGGITSFMEMPNTVPQTTSNAQLIEKQNIAAKKSLANYSFYLGATNDNLNEIEAVDTKTTCGIKVFMGSSTGNMLVDDKKILSDIFRLSPIIITTHCEDDRIIRANLEKYKTLFPNGIPFSAHSSIRNDEACYASSSMAVELAEKYNTKLHILHISSKKELSLFKNTEISNKKISSEVCIHHLWFNSNHYEQKGSLIKWNPSVKSSENQEALIDAVNNGFIDVIATDHAPHTLLEKNQDYEKSPSGGPMVQHSLICMLEMHKMGRISLETIVEKMCHSPAKLFNIDKRGFIKKGYWADLVLVDPKSLWTVSKDNILYKCGWSPLEGCTFNFKILYTFVNGYPVYNKGEIDRNFRGKALIFNR
ncbi:MAG: dihydroorotase [Bacteroidales bacterium]|nr:dihydroorotase [Bacteroidales bacterium]